MSWLHYLLEANVYLAVFYLLYFILLDKETHYKLNRIYLLSACIVAYIIPLVQIGILKPAYDGRQMVTIIRNGGFRPGGAENLSPFTLQNGLLWAYAIGAGSMLIMFFFKIFQLVKLTHTKKDLLEDRYKIIRLEDSNTAFSFFNYLFIGTKVSGPDTIIRHELVHINQKHSLDIVFLELIKIISWFNPFIYLLQRSLKTVHEYIADEQTAAFENDALTYSSFLVSNAYGVSGSSITHSFFNYNLLKKRIIMLNQKRSGNLARLKYLTALPVCAGLLCASTLGFSKTYGLIDIAPQKVADTTKTLKLKEVKASPTAIKVREEVNNQLKKAAAQQKAIKLKETPKSAKVEEITIDPVNVSGKASDLVKEAPVGKINVKGNVIAQNKKLTNLQIVGKAPKTDVIIDEPVTTLQLQKMPPPPPPAMPMHGPFEAVSKYIGKYTRFPAVAVEKRLTGSIIVKFDIDENHKISGVSILKGIGSGCDEEVKRVVDSYSETIDTKPGTYKLAVTFVINDVYTPKTASSDLSNDPSFAGEVVLSAFPPKRK